MKILALRRYTNFGIFSRSMAGYLIILFFLGASNLYAILKLSELNTTIFDSLSRNISALDGKKVLVDAIYSQRSYEQKYLLTQDRALYNQFLAEGAEFDRQLGLINSPAASLIQTSAAIIDRHHLRYQSLVNDEVRNLREKHNYNRPRYKTAKEDLVRLIHEELETIELSARRDIHATTKRVNTAGISARLVAGLSLFITILLTVIFALFITRSITGPLLKLVAKTREIPLGSFNCDLENPAPPEIMELTEAFNIMCLRLKEVENLKNDFFSLISHELKTPLTTIREGTNLLMEGVGGTISERQKQLFTIIGAESNRLINLVNSIMDLSRIEAGMMEYHFKKSNIAPLIERAVMEITPYAAAKNIKLDKEINPEMVLLPLDEGQILSALRNLLGNAVKFTPENGNVKIVATSVPEGLEVSVIDTGPGIPEEDMANIFTKYKSNDQKKGTGLGLAIVKHVITAHGGSIWVKSKQGEGSSFIFVLPY